jgi:hypothetical protein
MPTANCQVLGLVLYLSSNEEDTYSWDNGIPKVHFTIVPATLPLLSNMFGVRKAGNC